MKKIALIAAALALPLTAAAETYQLSTSSYSVKGKVTCSVAGNTLKPINVNIKLKQKTVPGMGFKLETNGGIAIFSNDAFWAGQDDLLPAVEFPMAQAGKKFNLERDDQSARQALTAVLKLAGYDSSYDTLVIDDTAKVPFKSVLTLNNKGKATLTEKASFKGQVGAIGSCNVVFNVARKSSGTSVL